MKTNVPSYHGRQNPTPALPLTLITLGLFYFVVNGLVLYVAAWLVSGFAVRGFGAVILGSLLVSLFSLMLDALFSGRKG